MRRKKLVAAVISGMLVFSYTPGAFAKEAVSQTIKQTSYLKYVVEAGDSLWKLSQRYGVTVDSLRQLNGLNSDMLYVGQQLLIKPMQNTGEYFTHIIQSGDTPWLLSQRFNVSLDQLLAINGMDQYTVLYVGQSIKIPKAAGESGQYQDYIVKSGDTPWLLSQRFGIVLSEFLRLNNLNEASILYIGQTLKIPSNYVQPKEPTEPSEQTQGTEPYITYITHTVQHNDSAWSLSVDYGIPMSELLKVNNLSERDTLYDGQKLTIPVHHVPVQPTVDSKHGELLDWWSAAQYVWPTDTKATVIDFNTGKSWRVQRSYGAFHADVEPVTAQDAATMKSVWGGWSWVTRPVIVVVNGHRIAASASAMPHSIEKIGSSNGVSGHFDIHFLNSHRHKDNQLSPEHQKSVHIAAGK